MVKHMTVFMWVGFVKDGATKHGNCQGSLAFFKLGGKKRKPLFHLLREKGPREQMIFLIYSTGAASQHFSARTEKRTGAIKSNNSVFEAF